MKKFLAIGLLSCAFAFTGVLAVACSDDDDPSNSSSSSSLSSSSATQMLGVTFEAGEGYEFLSNASKNGVPKGSTLAFEIDIGAFYAGSPEVYVNDVLFLPDADGVYSVPNVSEALTIRAEGIRKDVSVMEGSGGFEDAFVVRKPIDLLKIAQEVNRGNTDYSNACYVLANDIDCKGAELEIIGDNRTNEAIFSGSFVGVSDPNTGVIERHTISNFTINSEDSNYVGLFGAVFANMSLESTATFYGISLDNFTINAGVSEITGENKTVCAGGLIGYSVGANVMLCDVTDGEIFLYADSNYFSYAGGLIGYQMGFYDTTYGSAYPSEVAYAVCSTDIYVTGGVALYAGGVVGYTATNAPYNATTLVRNSYFQGNISNGLRSGGVVGGLGQYTSVSNCYAAGTISSQSSQSNTNPLIMTDEYCHAYAGGLVGYAENDSIVNDSFFNGEMVVSTLSNEDVYAHKDVLVGGGDPAGFTSVGAQKYIALDCLYNINLADDELLTRQLGWGDYDWVFLSNKLPTINYESPENRIQLTLTFRYIAPLLTGENKNVTVNGEEKLDYTYFDTGVQSLASYTPLGSYVSGETGNALLDLDYISDVKEGVRYLSYGYFFDAECTIRVPSGYTPEKNVTLFVGFADPTPLVGTEATERVYSIYADGSVSPLTITFGKDGKATYSDGSSTQTTRYTFDGQTILLKNARLARYFQGKLATDEMENADPYAPYASVYGFYDFKGVFAGEDIQLYDGAYFTQEAPLLCVNQSKGYRGEYYTADAKYSFYGNTATVEKNNERKTYALTSNGTTLTLTLGSEVVTVAIADLQAYDAFKGSWTLSANTDKVYTFDGAGKWSYTYKTYLFNGSETSYTVEMQSGSYTTADGLTLTLNDGSTATFNTDGFLTITKAGVTQVYYGAQSHVGVWLGQGYELQLTGITVKGYGKAILTETGGYITELAYEVAERGYINFYYLTDTNDKDALFGYGEYDQTTNLLTFLLPDAASGVYAEHKLALYDEYYGDWISDYSVFSNAILSFNGLGLYEGNGSLTIANASGEITTAYAVTGKQSGSVATFVYQGVTYELAFDEQAGNIVVMAQTSSLERKDELADRAFIDLDGVRYAFDGRSTLLGGTAEGKLTITDGANQTAYVYKQSANGFTIYDGAMPVGELSKEEKYYALTLNGDDAALYIENEFMGAWALSMQYQLFEIGPTDLNGDIQAYYKGLPVTLTFLTPDVLTFDVIDGKMPYTFYVFVVEDEQMRQKVLALSEYPYLMVGNYMLCTKANELYGTWKYTDNDGYTISLKFDGISTSYVNGYAELALALQHNTIVTDYFYAVRERGIVLWSQETMNNRTWYYRLDLVDLSEVQQGTEYFVNPNSNKALVRTEVDGLYLAEATDIDDEEVTYFFDGEGGLYVGDETAPSYTYVIKSYNEDMTATLEVTKAGKTYTATLDYADSENITLDIGEEITA